MREPSFLVLTVLASGRAHGWSILREIEILSQGRVRLQVGSLYAVLDRLQVQELISVDGEEEHGGRVRRYFVLTEAGEHALTREAEIAEGNAAAARTRLASRTRPATAL